MSRDDPTDDELEREVPVRDTRAARELDDDDLEREAARDLPIPLGGTPATATTRGHRPRLSTVSRAINPRELLEAERRAQSGDDEELAPPRAARPQPTKRQFPQPAPAPRGLSLLRQSAALSSAVSFRSPDAEQARAWDAYAQAALNVLVGVHQDADAEALADAAAEMADALLVERTRRFA